MSGPTFNPNNPTSGAGLEPNPNTVLHPDEPKPILPTTAATHGIGGPINGVYGSSKTQIGVIGESEEDIGVSGMGPIIGVNGTSATGDGVFGEGRRGVVGESEAFQGVFGHSTENAGVVGESEKF